MAFRRTSPAPSGHLQLRFRPAHNRNRADAVLWAAFDDPIAVGHIDQYVPLLVEEAHDLKRLEDETAPLVEDALAILDFALDLDRADLPACDAGVAGVLGHTESALHPSGLGSADVAGDERSRETAGDRDPRCTPSARSARPARAGVIRDCIPPDSPLEREGFE